MFNKNQNTMKETIYDIMTEYASIVEELEENGGELTEELEQRLAINGDNAAEKVESYCKIIRNLEASVSAKLDEADRINASAKRDSVTIDRMKNALKTFLVATDNRKFTAGSFVVGLRKSSDVNITDKNSIPDEYVKTTVTTRIDTSIDNMAVKEAIKNGEEVPGAEIKENTNLTIK